MSYRVYARFEGEKRFGALGSVPGGVDKVRNLLYAYIFDTYGDAEVFMNECKRLVPTAEFQIRKF